MQYLDFSALEHNALYFKKLLGDSKLCAVIKNNAYGHGIVHIARYIDEIVDCFAVGSIVEASQIKFVSKDILILLPQNGSNTAVAVRNKFILSADSFVTLDIISVAACSLQMPARVHIKIDSGMNRLGFKQNEIDKLVCYLRNHPEIIVEGVYSHFYGENVVECDKQLNVFLPCAATIEAALNKRLIKHIANSSGALTSSEYRLDMARIGLGLYGYGSNSLIPVKTVTAQIIALKKLRAGEVVGYGASYVAHCDTSVAVLNVGYAHGFSRALIGSCIKINGCNCKVLAVCMAMIMVDVTNVEVGLGDTAILLGDGVNPSNGVVSVYELLCNLK